MSNPLKSMCLYKLILRVFTFGRTKQPTYCGVKGHACKFFENIFTQLLIVREPFHMNPILFLKEVV